VPGTHAFPKSSRLLDSAAYSNVFDGCEYKASSGIGTLLSVTTALPCSRIGIVVAKRQVKQANQRNQVKRLVREDFRLRSFQQSSEYVFLARHPCSELNKAQFAHELDRLWQKLGCSERASNTKR
jgi:ribonuclease P protein component